MKEAHVRINIDNMNEAKEKAAELAETLEKAKVLITQLKLDYGLKMPYSITEGKEGAKWT